VYLLHKCEVVTILLNQVIDMFKTQNNLEKSENIRGKSGKKSGE